MNMQLAQHGPWHAQIVEQGNDNNCRGISISDDTPTQGMLINCVVMQ